MIWRKKLTNSEVLTLIAEAAVKEMPSHISGNIEIIFDEENFGVEIIVTEEVDNSLLS